MYKRYLINVNCPAMIPLKIDAENICIYNRTNQLDCQNVHFNQKYNNQLKYWQTTC
jgi:hypothetical protein